MNQPLWLVPFTDLDPAGSFLDELARAAGGVFGLEARLGDPVLLPANAYNRHRDQYRAESFLDALAGYREQAGAVDAGAIVLGITGLDLFVPKLNFIFGLAEPVRGTAVISLHRLRSEFYGEAPDPARLAGRVFKEAVHELGHIFGLPHCENPECIMRFSNSIGDTDRKGPGFCDRCRAKLEV